MYYTTSLFVYRCFLSAGSCPSRSRVVEALCILLCEKYPHPRKERDSQGRRAYTSRYVCMYVHKAHLHVFHALHLQHVFHALHLQVEVGHIRIQGTAFQQPNCVGCNEPHTVHDQRGNPGNYNYFVSISEGKSHYRLNGTRKHPGWKR